MTAAGWAQALILVGLLTISTPILGAYLTRVFGGGRAPGDRAFLPVERLLYRFARIDPGREQTWRVYAVSVLAFSFASVLLPSRERGA